MDYSFTIFPPLRVEDIAVAYLDPFVSLNERYMLSGWFVEINILLPLIYWIGHDSAPIKSEFSYLN